MILIEMPPKDLGELLRYWQGLSAKELAFAKRSLRGGKYPLQALFHLHLALEALLKANIVYRQKDHAPYSHNLEYLAGFAGLELSKQKLAYVTQLNAFNITGRYPEDLEYINKLEASYVNKLFSETGELMTWLKKQLKTR